MIAVLRRHEDAQILRVSRDINESDEFLEGCAFEAAHPKIRFHPLSLRDTVQNKRTICLFDKYRMFSQRGGYFQQFILLSQPMVKEPDGLGVGQQTNRIEVAECNNIVIYKSIVEIPNRQDWRIRRQPQWA